MSYSKDKFFADISQVLNIIALHNGLNVFLGALDSLKYELSTEHGDTACTDAYTVWVNPNYWAKLSMPQKLGLLLHEMFHAFLLHLKRFRGDGIDMQVANIACDYVINDILLTIKRQYGVIELPPGGLDAGGKFSDESEERIYNLLMQEKQAGPENFEEQYGDGNGPGGFEADESGAGEGDESTAGEGEGKWDRIAHQATQMAKLKGDFPGGLLEKISPSEPVVDLKAILSQFVRDLTVNEVSEDQFDRRFLEDGLYLESFLSPSIDGLAFAIDTSGSMPEALLSRIISSIQQAMDDVNIKRLWVLYVDAEVAHAEEFSSGSVIPLQAKGGGGTDFRPAFDWVDNNFPQCAAMIYFTDGYGTFPKSSNYPTLWINFGRSEYPFGQVLDVRDVAA